MQANGAYIVSIVRTAVGKADKGSLRNVRPEELGAIAVREAVRRVKGLEPELIDDVIMGCAFPEGPQGMNMGRIVAQKAGLPDSVPGATVNRFCSSGLQTIAMATQAIMAGHADVIVAGGTESMSQVPMTGFFFQPDPELVERDIDVYLSMGLTAENVAERYGITREEADRFALRSHQRAIEAIDSGKFDEEIVPVPVREVVYENGQTRTVEKEFRVDEGPRRDTSLEALAALRPVFRVNGTVTAGNASQKSDGAAAAVVMSERMVRELGVEPMGRLIGFALAGVPPEIMGIGPVEAIRKVLKQTGLTLDDIDLIELNEAFAAQALAVIREVGLDEEKVNVNGGAIALGHPLGCTGAKLTATLLYELRRRGGRYGLCTMCVGGGMGAAGIIENLQR
ncbi:acetyl-CoA acetyltransferase [Rhodothermus marinus SG0.5JP17-172]|uniref:thiolase family protein n=1 Tax=Rhodothermus marinus TaxID=29549 RepID=UPI000223DA71|nr:thiolase family protein [Rhodothermus marinus]AEN73008.1 acetyl-CoA acetyltransferase [Rhodothermus marinus SG0.5JP17-172]MBO2492258.1 thiolase family protein [Rhodothermus marinus]